MPARPRADGLRLPPDAPARRSGRLGWLGPPSVGEPPACGARELRPLRWDGDAPFVAQLRAEPAGRGIALRLEFARDGEIVPADRFAAFASAGWLITDDRLIHVEGCDDLGRWMAAAGRSPLRLPARELGVVIEKIGNAPRAPRLVLDALGWAVTPGTPVLRLYVEPIPRTTRLGARVAFRYGQVEAVGTCALVIDARSRRVVLRELAAEAAARAQLVAADLGWIAQPPGADHELTIEVARFLDRVSAMQDLGWELWVRGRRLRRGGRLTGDVETGIDWFDVSVAVDVEGLGADLPELLQALRDGQPFVPLTDGTMGIVLPEWLAGHARLAALGTLSHGAVRVPRAAAPLLDAMLATLPDVEIDAAFRRLRARLAAATAIRPCREPRSFRGQLRPYQREALGWFRFLDEVGLGGCLADDMGSARRCRCSPRSPQDQVLPDLPARTEQVLRCQLGADQRRQYDELLAHYRAALLPQVAREGMARSTMHVLEALLRLRQAACHPGLIDPRRGKAASAKLDALLEHVAEATESGHKALVFSQFTSFLALVRTRLDAGSIPYEYLDGQTRDRKQCVARFHDDPSCKLFLISLKAGGTGLNLTAADYVYLLDPWWNPAVEAQAIDRTHRPGQRRPVFAYRLIAADTVEDKILELQARKRQLADGIFADDGGGLAKLSIADLELLFS